MRHLILGTALALAASAAPIAGAQEVYQWKDANGVTHFSESPPPSGAYQQRRITSSGASTGNEPAATTAAAENPQCKTARNNIVLLQGEGPVAQEDGSELGQDERVNQLELAQAAVRAYCTDTASTD